VREERKMNNELFKILEKHTMKKVGRKRGRGVRILRIKGVMGTHLTLLKTI